jgi:predicted ATPase
VDVLVREHPLHRVTLELQLHDQCQELPLALLSEAAVDDYLAERFAGGATHASSLSGLASLLHRWTEGNPLFMVTLVDAFVQQSVLSEVGGQWVLHRQLAHVEVVVPASLHHLIEQHIGQLSSVEREVLEAPSVAGVAFAAATLTRGDDTPVETVEVVCEALARQGQFVSGRGFQAHACRLLGEIAMRRHPPEMDQAEIHYQQALALADEGGMRPLQAHCHRGLGTLYGHDRTVRASPY